MNIIQLGTCVGNDDLTKLIGETQPDILILIEPMLIHNEKITECYRTIKNKHIENIAISVSDEEEMSFFYHENDGPMYEVASTNINHITKHGYDTKGIKELKVKCLRINNLFKKFNLKKIDMLFIDTEGIDDLTQNDIYSFLENKGYRIIKTWGYMGWTSYAKKI